MLLVGLFWLDWLVVVCCDVGYIWWFYGYGCVVDVCCLFCLLSRGR